MNSFLFKGILFFYILFLIVSLYAQQQNFIYWGFKEVHIHPVRIHNNELQYNINKLNHLYYYNSMNIKVLLIIFMLSIVSNINASNYKFTYFAPTGTQTDDAECISTSGCSVDIDESNNAIYLSIEDSDQYFEIVNKKINKRYPYYTVSGNNNRIIYFWVHPAIVIMSVDEGTFILTNIPKTQWSSIFVQTK